MKILNIDNNEVTYYKIPCLLDQYIPTLWYDDLVTKYGIETLEFDSDYDPNNRITDLMLELEY